MPNVKVIVLRTAGTNCDQETAFAFHLAGANTELVHINQFIRGEKNLNDYQILALPGGFTYGDDVAAGKILANELRFKLIDEIREFICAGRLIIGICNGFQILVKSSLLPGNGDLTQEASLIINDSGKFEDRWVYLKSHNSGIIGKHFLNADGRRLHADNRGYSKTNLRKSALDSRESALNNVTQCIWTRNLPEIIYLPVAHGEGKFVTKDKDILERLKKNRQIIFQYCDERGKLVGYPDNPNGSTENIAGISDDTGRILGLMPHPERHIFNTQHPYWTRLKDKKSGDGLQIFRNGVEYARKNL